MAALSARRYGAHASVSEQSDFPRHKVCGEFLSPEIEIVLSQLGIWQQFLQTNPARISRVTLAFRDWERSTLLPQPAWGLSRFHLDEFLKQQAIAAGVSWQRTRVNIAQAQRPLVLAHGRHAHSEKGQRVFGFKAHHCGPQNDAVELHFFDGGYVGVNAIEGGFTNVCGLAREDLLRAVDFDPERLLQRCTSWRIRMRQMSRVTDWFRVGPLVYGNRLQQPWEEGMYPAGDALSFVDPFTGSGQLTAMATGILAGQAAAERWSIEKYRQACARTIGRPFFFSSMLRTAILKGWAEVWGPWVPAPILFRLTRPRVPTL